MYDLQGAPTGADALSTFLFTTHRGYCEQFASAMAVLVRALGIPARVAVGFTGGQSDGNGGYTVTTADAHAWPEVWFRGVGWVRFEPTPRGDGTATAPAYTFPPVAGPSTTSPDTTLNQNGTASATRNGAPLPYAERGDPAAEPGAGTAAPGSTAHSSHPLRWVVPSAAGLLVLLLLAPGVARIVQRRRRLGHRARHEGGPWREVEATLLDHGLPIGASESPRGVARRLADPARAGLRRPLDEVTAAAIGSLAAREERRRYAPAGPVSNAAAAGQDVRQRPDDAAVTEVAEVRRALRTSLPRRRRVRATVAPASVLTWVRRRVPAAAADVLDLGDRMMAAVAGRIPRPAGRG